MVQFENASISRVEFEVHYRAWNDLYPAEAYNRSKTYNRYLSHAIKLKQLALIASNEGIDREVDFKPKFSQFLEHTQKSGLLLRDIENWMLQEAYIRQQYVVKASHILVAVESSSSAHEKDALHELLKLRDELAANKISFKALARLHSSDPSASENSGQLGYFSVFEQIYPLETAAYETPVGVLSAPVKSRFGYHLVKVSSRDKIKGLKRASHIFVKHTKSFEKGESDSTKNKIDRIYRALTPTNFAEIASTYSEDYKTSIKGGDLGTDRLIDEVEAVKLKLPVGTYSKPFQSTLGWHIVKTTDIQRFQPFTKMRPQLRQMIKLDSRVERELDLINQAVDSDIESPVINAYYEELLCRLLLKRSTDEPVPEFSTRSDLINYLINVDLPRILAVRLAEHPATVNQGLLRSIFD